jgi:uncharacterized protein
MPTPYQDRKLVAPIPNPENAPYFTAATNGKLMLKKCRTCNEPHFYPRAICPHCFSSDTEWIEASGRGTIYSFSVSRKVGPTPFAIAFVTLAEGVSMLTNIVDCDLDAIRIGQTVRVVFKPTEGGPAVPMFTPAS